MAFRHVVHVMLVVQVGERDWVCLKYIDYILGSKPMKRFREMVETYLETSVDKPISFEWEDEKGSVIVKGLTDEDMRRLLKRIWSNDSNDKALILYKDRQVLSQVHYS